MLISLIKGSTMRLSMFTMLWRQGELKAWLRSNSLIVSKLTFGSDVMSAYSSSEKKLLQICTALKLEMWSKAVQKLRSHRLLGPRKRKTIGDHQDVQKNLNRGNVAKRFLRSFKLISCTAADYKFLFRTSKCFSKIEITVWIPRSKSQCSVKDWNHCSAFEIWTRCQESWKSSSKLHTTCSNRTKRVTCYAAKDTFTNLWNHLKNSEKIIPSWQCKLNGIGWVYSIIKQVQLTVLEEVVKSFEVFGGALKGIDGMLKTSKSLDPSVILKWLSLCSRMWVWFDIVSREVK